MESEEEYLAEFNHRKAINELCRERDRFPTSDPRHSKIQMVLDHADEYGFGPLYGFIAQLKLVEIAEMQAQAVVYEAISNLSKDGILREIEIKKSEREYESLVALGYTNLRKSGGRWIEGNDDPGWGDFDEAIRTSETSGEVEGNEAPPTVPVKLNRISVLTRKRRRTKKGSSTS